MCQNIPKIVCHSTIRRALRPDTGEAETPVEDLLGGLISDLQESGFSDVRQHTDFTATLMTEAEV